MRAVVTREALQSALRSPGGKVYGLVRPEEALLQVLAQAASAQSHFRQLGGVQMAPGEGAWTQVGYGEDAVFIEFNTGIPIPEEIEVVAVDEELDSRRVEVSDGAILEEKTVLVVGAGSLGSETVLPLAEAGVGHFVIVDPDRLDAANVSRHACDLGDLGREKAVAVADLLQRRCVDARALREDVLELGDDRFRELVRGADLVVATTDSPEAQFLTNEVCVAEEVSAIFVAAHERARGGELIVFRPNVTPCLFCCVGFRVSLGDIPEVRERRAAYQAADTQRLVAEPGLAVDLRFIAAVASAHALALIDGSERRASLLDPSQGFVLVHGGSAPDPKAAGLFAMPFEVLYARVERSEPCPVCGFSSRREETT